MEDRYPTVPIQMTDDFQQTSLVDGYAADKARRRVVTVCKREALEEALATEGQREDDEDDRHALQRRIYTLTS